MDEKTVVREYLGKKGFASSLKKYRTENSMTQRQLAEYLHVSLQTIVRWESIKDSSTPAMLEVPAIAQSLNMTIDELITGIPTHAVNIHRATGLSVRSIETLQTFRKSCFLRIVNAILSPDYYFESSFQMRELIDMKKSLFSGETADDFKRTQNIIRGIQAEIVGEYSRLLQKHTNHLAKKELESEGKKCLEEWEQRGYSPLTEDEVEAIFNDEQEG